MRVVLDTNIVISGIFWKGIPYRVLKAWSERRFHAIATTTILDEYYEVIHRIDTAGNIIQRWSYLFTEYMTIVETMTCFQSRILPSRL
jgi:putative PIN family toxin of toxin-antitoxin system